MKLGRQVYTLLCAVCAVAALPVSAANVTLDKLSADSSYSTSSDTSTTSVTVKDGEYIGAYNADGSRYTDFNTSYRTQNKIYQNAKVTIEGTGLVAIGGGNGKTEESWLSYDKSWLGRFGAKEVVINGKDDSTLNLKATTALIGTMTLNSGLVELHTGGKGIDDFGPGNSYVAPTGKQAVIYDTLNINGGKFYSGVKFGAYVTGVSASAPYNRKHCETAFGKEINQTGGFMAVRGDAITYFNPNEDNSYPATYETFSINQTGKNESSMYFTDNLNLANETMVVNQENDKASLVIGRIVWSELAKDRWERAVEDGNRTININQSGAGDIKLAYGTYFVKESTVNVDQSGAGTISIGGGITKDIMTATGLTSIDSTHYRADFTDKNTTYSFNQSGAGTINIEKKAVLTASEIVQSHTDALFHLKGKVTADSVEVGGTFVNDGELLGMDSDSMLIVIAGGSLENNNNIGIDVILQGGELTAVDGSVFASVYAASGALLINGEVSVEGSLTLGSQVSTFAMRSASNDSMKVVFGKDSFMKVQKDTFIGSNVEFIVSVDSVENVQDLELKFLQAEDGTPLMLDEQILTLTDGKKSVQVTYEMTNDGSIKVTSPAPEPTTATLSLLALAALAARRRRK